MPEISTQTMPEISTQTDHFEEQCQWVFDLRYNFENKSVKSLVEHILKAKDKGYVFDVDVSFISKKGITLQIFTFRSVWLDQKNRLEQLENLEGTDLVINIEYR